MIEIIQGMPSHVAAFRASGKITGADYDQVINPKVEEVYKEHGKIDFLLQIETSLSNYSKGAWFKDAVIGFVYLTEWRKVAIVSPQGGVKRFTNFFGNFVPGKYRGFRAEELDKAKAWVSNQ